MELELHPMSSNANLESVFKKNAVNMGVKNGHSSGFQGTQYT